MIDVLHSEISEKIKKKYLDFFHAKNLKYEDSYLNECVLNIMNAHVHPLEAQGKLIRPLLLLLTAGVFGGKLGIERADACAIAVEFVHTYSLVHDDLPCMDNDSLRRGKPTVHTLYGEAKGLLVGDGLLTAAFEILSDFNSLLTSQDQIEFIHILSRSIGVRGMIWGQWLDISASAHHKEDHVNEGENWHLFHAIHLNKTGKLFAACLEMGLLCGLHQYKDIQAGSEIYKIREMINTIGLNIGLFFQIVDDILDQTQSSSTLGKTSGKDNEQNKLTVIKILGLDASQKLADDVFTNLLRTLRSFFDSCKNYISSENQIYCDELFDLLERMKERLN